MSLIESAHILPEPLDYLMVLIVSSFVLSVRSPVVDVYEGHSVQYHVEFPGLEDDKQLLGYYPVDSLLQSLDVATDTLGT